MQKINLLILFVFTGMRTHAALLALIVWPLALKAPLWSGWLISDPLISYGGLATDVGGRILPGLPTIDPNIAYTADALGRRAAQDWLDGTIPWWNPYEGSGAPLAAEMQSAALFLPFVLLYALPGGQLWLHLCFQIIAGLGTFFLLRNLGVGVLAAVTGGLLFEMNGTYAWLATATINPIPFLPWLLLGVEKSVWTARQGHGAGWLWIPAALSLSLYAGFPEVAYINGLLVLIWAIVRFAQLKGRQRWRFFGLVTIGGLTGILLSLPVVVPFFEYLRLAEIGGHIHEFGNAFLPRSGLAASLFPYLYGPILPHPAQEIPVWRGGGYFGLGLVVLAVFSLAGPRERWLKGAILAWVMLGLAKTFGVPGISEGFNWLPMLEQAAFYRYVWPSLSMGLTVLAALALDELVGRRWDVRIAWVVLLSLILAVGLALIPALDSLEQLSAALRQVWWMVGSLVLGTLAAGVLIGLIFSRHPWSAPLIAGVLLLEATILFLIPVFAYPKRASLHLEGVEYLKQHLGLQRFYTTGPLAPNYGSAFGISQLNYNDLPVPKNLTTYVLANLDPYIHPILFIGNRHADPAAPSPLKVLRDRIGAFARAGVSHIVARPEERLDLDQYEVPIQVRDNRALMLQAGETLQVRLPYLRPGELQSFGVLIGTYHGKADGLLGARLCQQGHCITAVSEVKNARDNDFLRFDLSVPLKILPEAPVEIGFRYLNATHPVAVWLWPQAPDSPQKLYSSAADLDGGLWLKFGYRTSTHSAFHIVHQDPVMTIYALDHFRAYFSAKGCRLRARSRNTVESECDHPSRLVRLETFYPGWQAEVNGSQAPIEETEGLFQQVALPRGRAVIHFTYQPKFYSWIMAGFLGGWIMLLASLWWFRAIPPDRP